MFHKRVQGKKKEKGFEDLILQKDLIEYNLQSERYLLKKKEGDKNKELRGLVKQFVAPLLSSDCIVEPGPKFFRVCKWKEEVNYYKEMFTISILDSLGFQSDENEIKIEFNYYTTSDTASDWELDRLMKLGKLAELFSDKQGIEQLKKDVEEVYTRYEGIDSKLRDLKNKYDKIQHKIDKVKKQSIKETLMEGYEFKFKEEYLFKFSPAMQDHISSIKVIGESKTGKTATIEYTRLNTKHAYRSYASKLEYYSANVRVAHLVNEFTQAYYKDLEV